MKRFLFAGMAGAGAAVLVYSSVTQQPPQNQEELVLNWAIVITATAMTLVGSYIAADLWLEGSDPRRA